MKGSLQKTRRLTLASLLSALGVVLLAVGAWIEVLDISMAVIASLCVILAVIELGAWYPLLVYSVISLLSLLLLPVKTPALFFLLFFGYYPILKAPLERALKRFPCWIIKILIFNAVLIPLSLLAVHLFTAELALPSHWYLFLPLGTPVFMLYDVALTRLITLYLCRLRSRFKFFK